MGKVSVMGTLTCRGFFALMADAESMQKHGQSPAMQAAMSAFGPLVAGPPKMSVTTPAAALGLDL